MGRKIDRVLGQVCIADSDPDPPVQKVSYITGCIGKPSSHNSMAASATSPKRMVPWRFSTVSQASIAAASYRLTGATLYCTLEPCPMCAGALVAARIRTLVFGARDLRFGGIRSKFRIADSPLLNHQVEIVEGVLGAESTAMLQRFFNARR